MIWAAIFAAFWVWLCGLVLLPVTIRADSLPANGRNWPGLIVLRRGLPVPGAVWAQEFWEARHAWRWLPLHGLLILLGRAFPANAWYERDREAMGHEVEVQAEAMLTGTDASAIRRREARDLASYRCFTGWQPDTIEAAMRRKSWDAETFVRRHAARIRAENQRS